ncbi:MAG: hypothetical protein QE269_10765 [Fimbriimonas sp.]|nr:hypothetical protein [Fimbriimonas sp.]
MSTPKYLLYIDILGFSNLVDSDWKRVDDLFRVVAGLNAHDHTVFRTIVFSDTIVIYNDTELDSEDHHDYIVMFMCEFAKDLLYRLAGRNISFRAVLVKGPFTHYNIKSTSCFYGQALINAYRSEKELPYTGLFISREISRRDKIFSTRKVNEDFDFVYITQALQQVELLTPLPFPAELFEDLDYPFLVYPELLYWKTMRSDATTHSDERVRQKCANTTMLLEAEYPSLRQVLYDTDFDLSSISPIDWDAVASRFPEDHSYVLGDLED